MISIEKFRQNCKFLQTGQGVERTFKEDGQAKFGLIVDKEVHINANGGRGLERARLKIDKVCKKCSVEDECSPTARAYEERVSDYVAPMVVPSLSETSLDRVGK